MPQIETIVRLKPDLVLLSDSQRITGRLHELGLSTFALDTESYSAIARTVTAHRRDARPARARGAA